MFQSKKLKDCNQWLDEQENMVYFLYGALDVEVEVNISIHWRVGLETDGSIPV